MKIRPIHFLCYMNRSGSTLLAKKLNSFIDIAVGLEGLEFRFDKKLLQETNILSENDVDHLIERVYKEKKFSSWGVDRQVFRQELLNIEYPIGFDLVLSRALNLYFKDNPAKVCIHKGNLWMWALKLNNDLFDASKCIFIDRDPRGIYNSQRKAVDSLTHEIMRKDIVSFAIHYKGTQNFFKNLRKNKRYNNKFLCVKYEKLLVDEQTELASILQFLGCSPDKIKEENSYSASIPEAQKHLHKNIDQGNITSRINGWQNELSNNEVWFLEYVLKKDLKQNDYHTFPIRFANVESKLLVIKWLFLYFTRYSIKAFAKHLLIRPKYCEQRE